MIYLLHGQNWKKRMPNQLIEYIKLHKLSLEQDYDKTNLRGSEYLDLETQISVLDHILDYAQDLTNPLTKE